MLGAAKSCEIDVDCDVIPVSSPSNGQWSHAIPGLKSWKVTTNHLLGMDTVPSHRILAVGTSHQDGKAGDNSYCIVDGVRYAGGTRGLQLRVFDWDSEHNRWSVKANYQYDTYGSSAAMADMAADIYDDVENCDLVVITSFDAYAINSELAAMITNILSMSSNSVPVVTASRSSFVCIGIANEDGISFTNTSPGSKVHATMLLDSNRLPLPTTPMRDAMSMVGTTVNLALQADGLSADRLEGQAIVRQWRGNGTLGNLANGGFSFTGTGPLQ